MDGKNIIEPFRGKILDPYSLPENLFVKITDNTKNKILLIDNIKSFDKFTNKYGQISGQAACSHIKINWDSVNMDYNGFYLDKNQDFYNSRYKKAFYNNKKYTSWLYKNKISPGLVYLFE